MALALICGCDAGVPAPVHQVPRDAKADATPDARVALGSAAAAEPLRPPIAEDLSRYVANLPKQGRLVAAIETSEGTLHCTLFADTRPMTVANFVGLATGQKPWMDPLTGFIQRGRPFYDGLTFHRVIPEFVIQGGDPLGKGAGGPGYQFANEIVRDGPGKPGMLGMANAGRDTNGSQFFIVEQQPREDLIANDTFFGQCDELDIVKRIARVPRDASDHPNTPVVIRKVAIYRASR